MSQSPCQDAAPRAYTRLPASVLYILRSEGLATAALTAILYSRTGASWWIFVVLWLVPDLSMLGYFAGPYWGSRIYNAVHAYTLPATLALCALLVRNDTLIPFALIWANHIAVDRVLGYGLKYPSKFGWTHLGAVGRETKPTT
ncbi:DUF4260 domain-containing protein [Occallatibacter riparius]|uniref:DUF4260 domain-containing protein n=1 Tax=Occallatibacter riparius TaxID=1002689 RepID=A0A9J7BXI6_9BACT|nr:DUF4260 domain-containing protein [Occallatibacter riparius]UWZ85893.1 DUF4260 domain-containing protein [Occallatibacter riparius]